MCAPHACSLHAHSATSAKAPISAICSHLLARPSGQCQLRVARGPVGDCRHVTPTAVARAALFRFRSLLLET